MSNSVDPSGSTLFASILNSSVMLDNYLQQTTSADNIFRCIFFLGALRVNWQVRVVQRMAVLLPDPGADQNELHLMSQSHQTFFHIETLRSVRQNDKSR